MAFHPGFLSPMVALLLLMFLTPSAEVTKPSLLVDNICKQISNYTFCVEALYSDPRTYSPDTDNQVLAYISFGLAYLNATNTYSHITDLLSNGATIKDQGSLQRCQVEYKKAVSATEEAYGDLDSETYSSLGVLAVLASHSAANCEGAFNETGKSSPLSESNKALMGLCEICVVVSNLFT